MTRLSNSSLLQNLQAPINSPLQLAALERLKNELIGHSLKKRAWIDDGLIPILVRILSSKRSHTGKRSSRTPAATAAHQNAVTSASDSSCIQATVIVGIMAQGEPIYIKPLLHSKILPHLISNLSSNDCSQTLMLATLKTLNTIANYLPPSSPDEWHVDNQLSNLLYAADYIGSFARIIGQSSVTSIVQQSISLAIALMCKTCETDKQKNALVDAGVLDVLATRLASFVVAQGFVLPGAEGRLREAGSLGAIPPSAPPRARLEPTLNAIALIIERSKARAELFLSSPGIVTVFPRPQAEFSPADVKKTPWGTSTYLSGTAVPRHNASNPIDSLLPFVPSTSSKVLIEQANFPPLGSGIPMPKKRASFHSPSFPVEPVSQVNVNDEEESPVIAWLIHRVRAETGMCRLAASRLLVALFSLRFCKKSRAAMFCMLLIPPLVKLLDSDSAAKGQVDPVQHDVLPLASRIQEEVPGILATLAMDNRKLQKAAVDCHAIPKLAQLLKTTFNGLPDSPPAIWSAEKDSGTDVSKFDSYETSDRPAPTPLMRHVMRFREGILQALAAISSLDDEYKKAICDQGCLPFIIESLKPYTSSRPVPVNGANTANAISGNAEATLLAACGAARSLTRAVSVLRTSLIDAGIGPPFFTLLMHDDIEVQIAATKVLSNLAVDFSPMREAIVQHNLIKSLCQHAHSAIARLRRESLWALKHLVLHSTNDIKVKVVEELGPDWIKRIIATDPVDIPEGTVLGVDLTPVSDDDQEDVVMTDGSGPTTDRYKSSEEHPGHQSFAEADDLYKHTVQDDTEIQVEALDLIRNLFCGEEAPEMIEYIFKHMGMRDFFEILHERVRPKNNAAPSRKDSKTTPAPSEVILKVLFVIVHIAASLPKFRTIITAQTNLLRLILTFLSHPHREIRVQCCWIAINLTYADDESDRMACKQRATELQKMGFLQKLRTMGEDSDLDVRERTKTAISLIEAHSS